MAEKKILFVTHLFYPAPGGVETHLHRLSQGLAQKRHHVKVLTTNAYSTEAFFLNDKRRIQQKKETINGVEVERLGFRTFGRRTLNFLRAVACRFKYPASHWIRTYSYGPRNPRFYKRILEIKPDLILAAPLPTFNIYYAWKGAKKMGIPLIINPAFHIHDPLTYVNPVFFRIMREANLLAVHSQKEKRYIAETAGIPFEKIKIFPPLPFGKEDLSFPDSPMGKAAVKKKYGIEQETVLLFIGQHGRHKNIPGILKALPRIWKHRPDTALVIAGGTTAYTPNLKQIHAEMDSESKRKVYFFDNFPKNEKDQFFKMSDIFISLSDLESFGIVFAEAMLHKLPVVASVSSVADSIVKNFKTGLLVNPYCEEEVAGAVMELLMDEGLRKQYGENGRQVVLSRYDPDTILAKWEELLSSIIYCRTSRHVV
jgi:glycosyltransferase involved in cell wall biosynthesis